MFHLVKNISTIIYTTLSQNNYPLSKLKKTNIFVALLSLKRCIISYLIFLRYYSNSIFSYST